MKILFKILFLVIITHDISGAICSSVEDLSLVYSLLATPDFDYPIGTVQPPVKVISDKPLNKIRACFDSRWFKVTFSWYNFIPSIYSA